MSTELRRFHEFIGQLVKVGDDSTPWQAYGLWKKEKTKKEKERKRQKRAEPHKPAIVYSQETRGRFSSDDQDALDRLRSVLPQHWQLRVSDVPNTPYWLVMADDLMAEPLERDVTKAAERLADAAGFVVEEFLERYADDAECDST